jgi:hypothetical protein
VLQFFNAGLRVGSHSCLTTGRLSIMLRYIRMGSRGGYACSRWKRVTPVTISWKQEDAQLR